MAFRRWVALGLSLVGLFALGGGLVGALRGDEALGLGEMALGVVLLAVARRVR